MCAATPTLTFVYAGEHLAYSFPQHTHLYREFRTRPHPVSLSVLIPLTTLLISTGICSPKTEALCTNHSTNDSTQGSIPSIHLCICVSILLSFNNVLQVL